MNKTLNVNVFLTCCSENKSNSNTIGFLIYWQILSYSFKTTWM